MRRTIRALEAPRQRSDPAKPSFFSRTTKWLRPSSWNSNSFMKEMLPLLMAYRLLSQFPFQITKDGSVEVKIFSFQMLYFLVTYCAQTYLVLENIKVILHLMLNSDDFPHIVLGGFNICIMLFHFKTPLSLIKEWKLMCDLFNMWTLFQVRYREVMRDDYRTTLNLVVIISVCAIPVTVFLLVGLHNSILIHGGKFFLLSYSFVITSLFYTYAIWVTMLVEVIRISNKIRRRSFEIVESKTLANKTQELYNMRVLWHDLSSIVRSASDAVASSMIFAASMEIIIFVSSAYGFLQCIALGDERYLLFLNVMIASGFFLIVPCETGYRVSLHVGTYIVEMLSSINVKEQGDTTGREVDLFLQAVFANYPNVSYGGMVIMNRNTITGILTATLTYLIVLLQLQVVKKPTKLQSSIPSKMVVTFETLSVNEGTTGVSLY